MFEDEDTYARNYETVRGQTVYEMTRDETVYGMTRGETVYGTVRAENAYGTVRGEGIYGTVHGEATYETLRYRFTREKRILHGTLKIYLYLLFLSLRGLKQFVIQNCLPSVQTNALGIKYFVDFLNDLKKNLIE